MSWVFTVLLMIAVPILVALLALSRAKHENKGRRGVEPGEGDQLIDNGYHSGGFGGGHGSVMRLTRDPKEYSKAMMPGHKGTRK